MIRYHTAHFFYLLFAFSCLLCGCGSKKNNPLDELVQRQVPWLKDKLIFDLSLKQDEDAKDRFSLESANGKITIWANSITAGATGLNWYLKYYCRQTISHTGDNIEPLSDLPAVPAKVRKQSFYRYRYALNYCTDNYTMSFWDWPQWEKELDWMALNGVNLLLVPAGNEMIWYNVIRKLGIPDSLAIKYAPGPAFTAWWLMGNLEGWGGPLSVDFMQRQVALQQKILKRCTELGIEPVVQGFYGIVPTFIENYFPDAMYVEQGKWEGGFQRPVFLDPADPLFEKIAGLYYNEYRHLYGDDIKYFGGDPFHEGGATGGLDLGLSAKKIYDGAAKYYPGARWVLQAWQGNPREELLEGFGKGNALVLDLFGESDNYWEKRKGYSGHPWVWCVINNFGEKTGMWGKLNYFATEPVRALQSPYAGSLSGIGIMPEGINNNAVVYDLVLEMAWHHDPVNINEWIKNYAAYRYGQTDEHIQKGWELLLRSVYSSSDSFNILGPVESVFLAKPSLNVQAVSTWGVTTIYYDPELLRQAVNEFLSVAGKYWSKPTFRYDIVDMCRELISAKGKTVYDNIINHYRSGKKNDLRKEKDRFLGMLLQMDSVCSLHEGFTLHKWLNDARAKAKNPGEDKQFVQNAKVQISYWGPADPASSLIDYANKQWSGMLRSYYYRRWQPYLDSLIAGVETGAYQNNREPAIDHYTMMLDWAKDTTGYDNVPLVKDPVPWLRKVVAGLQ